MIYFRNLFSFSRHVLCNPQALFHTAENSEHFTSSNTNPLFRLSPGTLELERNQGLTFEELAVPAKFFLPLTGLNKSSLDSSTKYKLKTILRKKKHNPPNLELT